MGQLLGLAGVIAGERRPDGVLAAALPLLLDVAGAEAAFVLAPTVDGPRVTERAGRGLDPGSLPECHPDPDALLNSCPVPASWITGGITRVSAHLLPGNAGMLVLAWGSDAPATDGLELALTTVDAGLARNQTEEKLADLVTRVDNAQQLAHMGDYDWHIPTDTNTWSDQLFRIYGHEPQSFNPSYERFLSLIHPDDRERISALHQRAYATGEAYAMIERIVRPDGEVRFLSSNGQVIFDDTKTPVRMRGTCIDITERVLADQERQRIAARFQGLVNSAPDAILVLGEEQLVLEANQRAHELLGGDPTGHGIYEIFPGWPDNGTSAVHARGLDGSDLQLDVTSVVVKPIDEGEPDGDTLDAVFLRDARSRLEREALAAKLGEAQLRRRQALEINDNVVQGLVAAVYALDQGATSTSASYLDRTLSAARAMMDDLLDPIDGEGLQAGDLVRSAPALIGAAHTTEVAEQEPAKQATRMHRVLLVDDAEDLRMLLRVRMETRDGLTVVGEAADGLAAVELATELQPDLVMLDLAMPRMDGLEALPLIRDAVPGVRVIVLSGFNQNTLADKAIAAGADRYVVKGGSMRELLELVESVLDAGS